MSSLFNFWSNAHCPTASATLWENSVSFDTGGNVAAPGFVVSTIPPNEWAAFDIISFVINLAVEAIAPNPSAGYIKALLACPIS